MNITINEPIEVTISKTANPLLRQVISLLACDNYEIEYNAETDDIEFSLWCGVDRQVTVGVPNGLRNECRALVRLFKNLGVAEGDAFQSTYVFLELLGIKSDE